MIWLIVQVFILTLFFQTLYRGLNSPLSHIPGPFISRWTSLVVTFHWFRGDKPAYIDALHKKYGPVVRISPEEIDICDTSAAKEIYKVGGRFLKSEWYQLLIPRRSESLFSMLDWHLHSARRRLLASPLSDSSLTTRFESQIRDRVKLAISKISEEMECRGLVDVFKWWLFMATDIIGELSFGESFRMLEKGQKNQYIHDLEHIASLAPIRTTFPFLVDLGEILPLPIFSKTAKVIARLDNYAVESIERYKSLLAKDTLFTRLSNAGERGISDQETLNEARGYIVAGSDTTAVTLTYLVYAVCSDSHIRSTLVSELNGLPDKFTDRDTRNLPYLNQVINETLRLYTAVPGPLPRVVPEEGACLAGYNIPGGVTVSTQAYSMHRDERIFPDPHKFKPERWSSPTKAMKDVSLPFGGGSRS
ncbi:cytochrome P450 [Aspergillus tanneri]|uniref:Cytochrome P450 n=1 Tax=Aspergillus tanneri TaxID=1220188 RepID=A0A5M9MUL3_9EURO|nr:uncharacterized protein ATNIH1004_003444 [Aspergillus tanneri]KAA8650755.1 hypothetical protein ATNIH1004_003444 [Aspergillus tanneri]